MSYAQQINVVRLILQETGTYNDQYRRPYVTELSGTVCKEIIGTVQEAGGISSAVMSGLSNQFLAPSATPESPIIIPNTWREKRYRFVMILEVQTKLAGRSTQVLTGWTEYCGASLQLSLDPNMVFHVNNTITIRNVQELTPSGVAMRSNMVDASHVLINPTWDGVDNGGRINMMRPVDVYSTMGMSHLSGVLSDAGSFDSRSALMSVAQKSRRSNGVASEYASDILSNYVNAAAQPGANPETNNENILMNARQYATEQAASRDPFLQSLASLNGSDTVTDVFTLRDLTRMDPNVMAVTNLVSNEGIRRNNPFNGQLESEVHEHGQTRTWDSSDLHCQLATVLSNAIPGLMLSNMLTKIAFTSTNMAGTGQPATFIADAASFNKGINLKPYAEAFRVRFEKELLKDLTMNNQISFALECQSDLLGETRLKLMIDGITYEYATPSFADALLTPVLTSNYHSAVSLADDFQTLVNQLTDNSHYETSALPTPETGEFGLEHTIFSPSGI